jgi:hypothetical protein
MKQTTTQQLAALERRIVHLENFARAAIAFYELLQAFANKTPTEDTHA